jgi:uncharacterized protein (DUF2267 family)
MTAPTFYRNVREAMGGDTARESAKRATAAVFHALRDRLTAEEADQVMAQLPTELKEVWQEGERAGRQPLKMNREEFYQRVKDAAGVASRAEARWVTLAVFGALRKQLSPGEAGDVLAQLPRELKELWAEASPAA